MSSKTSKLMVVSRSLPGSGKTTQIKQKYPSAHSPNNDYYLSKDNNFQYICSTDDYWLRPDGTYDFNYGLLTKSHEWNKNRVKNVMIVHEDVLLLKEVNSVTIIVDNVNVNMVEIEPYAKLAKQYGYVVTLFEPDNPDRQDLELCFKRNTHGVPYATILRMYHAWQPSYIVYDLLEEFGCKVLRS